MPQNRTFFFTKILKNRNLSRSEEQPRYREPHGFKISPHAIATAEPRDDNCRPGRYSSGPAFE